MKGILLTGGSGTRLWPLTKVLSKGILPVFDKPMVYYPLTTLMLMGIKEILLISDSRSLETYRSLLGDGSQWGISISYLVQLEPNGIAEAITLGSDFISGSDFTLILGDNLIYGSGLGRNLLNTRSNPGALIFAFEVSNPSDYGVVAFNSDGNPEKIIEKPINYISNWAIPGLYIFDSTAVERTLRVTPSARGELEIVDVLKSYLDSNELRVEKLNRGTAWLDLGSAKSLLEAGNFVQTLQDRQGLLIGSPDEAAWRMGWIDKAAGSIESAKNSSYTRYLDNLTKDIY
jgi:glucose-1-phosphate thymidylyltransferase